MELRTAKGRLLTVLLVLLFVPMLATILRFIHETELKGAVRNTPMPAFSWKDWWSGAYQEQVNQHLNDSIGGRTWLVKINNQVDYSLFKKLHARDVALGKDNYLYETKYIESYCGRNHIGPDFVRMQMGKLKFIQDTLDRLGSKLILVYAPSKARFFPEYLPGCLACQTRLPTEYDDFIRIGDSLHIRQLDFDGWFVQLKEHTHNHPLLMSKMGIHWTVYGAMLATDSLQRFMEKEKHIDMPDVSWQINAGSYSGEPRNADADIYEGLNIFSKLSREKYCYPDITIHDDSTKKKPRAVYIADSFFWVVSFSNIVQRTHSDWQFWFYFHEAWGSSVEDGALVRKMDWQQEMMRSDFMVLMYTEPGLEDIGSGFIDSAYNYFYKEVKKETVPF